MRFSNCTFWCFLNIRTLKLCMLAVYLRFLTELCQKHYIRSKFFIFYPWQWDRPPNWQSLQCWFSAQFLPQSCAIWRCEVWSNFIKMKSINLNPITVFVFFSIQSVNCRFYSLLTLKTHSMYIKHLRYKWSYRCVNNCEPIMKSFISQLAWIESNSYFRTHQICLGCLLPGEEAWNSL